MTDHAQHSDNLFRQAIEDAARRRDWSLFDDNLTSLMATLVQLRHENAALDRRIREAEAKIAVLRQIDQLDQALASMSVIEIDTLRARVNDTLVPQIARMLALMLVRKVI